MKAASLIGFFTVAMSVAAGWSGIPPGPAAAATAAVAYPGMTIIQGESVCTLGYVDPARRIGYSAGHCNTDAVVRDKAGDLVGEVISARHNRAGQAYTAPTDRVIDHQVIRLSPAVMATDRAAPSLVRRLVSDPSVLPQPGMQVCHVGVTTGLSCGEIAHVYNGWFTMAVGGGDLTSADGDSGGPVYTRLPDRSGLILLGLFRGRHGNHLAAVTWADVEASSRHMT